MVSSAAYRIIKRAIKVRITNGEKLEDAVAAYTKLSPEQMQQMIQELTEEGYAE